MYFDATLSLDPSQITELRHVKPSRAFGRLFYYLTAGRTGDDEEVETFTAVSILQQLNMAMRSLGFTNIVRLARDGRDYYLDTHGRTDDFEEAMKSFERKSPGRDLGPFRSLKLVLEHSDDDLKYLVEIDVARAHAPGQAPIVVRVGAVIGGLNGRNRDEIAQKLAPVFADQSAYDTFVRAKRARFDAFLIELAAAIQAAIPCDRIASDARPKIVRPRQPVEDTGRLRTRRTVLGEEDDEWAPLFHGYAGFDEAMLYAWSWTRLAAERSIRLRDFTLVDEAGHAIADVGAEGLDAAHATMLLPGHEMTALPGDVTYHPDHAYRTELAAAGVIEPSAADAAPRAPADNAWLGGMFEGGAHVHDHDGDGGGGSGCGGCDGSGG